MNFENFPDSAYTRELRRSPADLRFEAPLEAEYTGWHLQRVRRRAKVWFGLTFALALFFTGTQWPHTGLRSLTTVLQTSVLIPCTALLAWLPWSRQYERFYMPVARVLVVAVGALIAAFIARDMINGQVEQLAALTVHLLAVFFFCGLMFRPAVLTAVIMLISFTSAALLVGLPHAMLFKSMVVLTLTALLGAIVYRDIEQFYRRSFLEGALIKELVARDELSGLMNRRTFDGHLLRVWQHALRDQCSLAVLMIDVDLFKRYNDVRGHQAGDAALRSVSGVIQGFARRPLDLAARYGGEEFAVILYDLTLEHVQDTAERLRQGVQNLQIKLHDAADSDASEVTVSVGVGVVVPTSSRTPHGAVQLADEALYEAKRAGRNRVVVKAADEYRLLDTRVFRGPRNALRRD